MNPFTGETFLRNAVLICALGVSWAASVEAQPLALPSRARGEAGVHGNKGNALALAAKYDEATVEFTAAIALSPEDERLYADRGRTYRAAAKLGEALADFQRVIEIAPNSDVGYLERGQTLMMQNSYDLALVDYNRAIELNPNNPVGYDRRGYAFYNLKQYEDAIRDYTSSIEEKPDNPLTFNRRADAYVAMKRFAQALPDLEAALKLKPKDFDTTQRLRYVNAKLRKLPSARSNSSSTDIVRSRPKGSGSGFFITEDGYLITNEHVAGDGAQVRLRTAAGVILVKVVKLDAANDLALLKAEGKFAALPVVTSRPVKLGDTVATVGFPNVIMQGFAPKFARGDIGSLSGPQDDSRYFQISVPVQPGNSGGALVDEHGNVVGVVCGTLSAKEALARSGALPQNVNYAVKSSFLLGFLESVPEVAAKLKEPSTKDMKFADVVEQAKEAAVLVLVY